jgi:hypothetical protein
MALDPVLLQDPVDPEPVQPRFLDRDDRKDVPRPSACFLLELGQARKKSGGVTAAHRCFDIFSLPGASEVMT